MERITGNFLTQVNRDFPLDCETLDYLQRLAAYGEVLGNIAGDRVVVLGCEAVGDGTRRGPGYVFVRTVGSPEGEIMYWEGGTTAGGMYVKEEAIGVSANNVEYAKAYTRRSLAPGVGSENYRWEDFTDVRTLRELMAENASLREAISSLREAPLGVVEMWAGREVPEGYVLCNGAELRADEYPALYAALGGTFNAGVSASGTPYSTREGYFRVPDLRGRFVVGQHDSDNDYRTAGAGGGLKKVTLTGEEMPVHSHGVQDYYYPESSVNLGQGHANPTGSTVGSGRTDVDNDSCLSYEHDTAEAGGGMAHENRPPYYVLAYIMRAK